MGWAQSGSLFLLLREPGPRSPPLHPCVGMCSDEVENGILGRTVTACPGLMPALLDTINIVHTAPFKAGTMTATPILQMRDLGHRVLWNLPRSHSDSVRRLGFELCSQAQSFYFSQLHDTSSMQRLQTVTYWSYWLGCKPQISGRELLALKKSPQFPYL